MAKIESDPPRRRILLAASFLTFGLVSFLTNVYFSFNLFFRLGDDAAVYHALNDFTTSDRRLKNSRLALSSMGEVEATSPSTDIAVPNPMPSGSLTNSSSTDAAAIRNPIPPPGNSTFAACLLWMDDNPRLIEFLSFHYFVLPLRYLIVAVDPRSRTSPTEILNRYREMGMYIEEWTDADFMDRRLANNVVPDDARFQLKRDRHRARQKVFYRSCLIKMKEANRTFVTLHDTDEFLTYNHAGGTEFEAYEARMQALHNQSRNRREKRNKPIHTPPSTAEEGAMLPYILKEKAGGNPYFQSPCISVPRLHFGAVESTEKEQQHLVPKAFASSAEQFDTLRWRKHAPRNDFVKNNLAKVIFDVSRVDMASTGRFRSLHRPIPAICQAPWVNDWEAGLRINHYLGSWEAYSFRDDARRGGERSRETWEFQAADQDETDDNIRPWLGGFVAANGVEASKSLLRGAGLPKGYRNKNETAWRNVWIDDILKSNETEGTNPRNHEFDAFIRAKYEGRDKPR